MEQGKLELSYNYVPADGWQQGVYSFKLELEVGGQILAKGKIVKKKGKYYFKVLNTSINKNGGKV